METFTRMGLFGISTSLKCHPLILCYTCIMVLRCCDPALITSLSGFHLATKIWGGNAIKEWAYLARQVLGTYL